MPRLEGNALTIAQRQTAGLHPTYVIYRDPTTNDYYARSTRSALVDYGPEADAWDVFDSVDAAMNGIGGAQAFIKAGSYDFGHVFHPRNFNGWVGESKVSTILRPANNAITPLVDLDREEGTANRQEKVRFENLKIDMRDYTNNEAFHLHNVKDSLFKRLWIKGVKKTVFYMNSTDTGYSFWNQWKDIQLDCTFNAETDPTLAPAIFHMEKNILDSWITRVWGTATNSIAFRTLGCTQFTIRDYWATGNLHVAYLHPNLNGGGYAVTNLIFIDCVSDHCKRHSYYLNRTNGTLTDITFHRPVFMQDYTAADTYSPFYLVCPGGSTIYRVIVEKAKHLSNMTNHKYIAEFGGGGALADCLFDGNMVPTGNTGHYLGIDPDFVRHDRVWIKDVCELASGTVGDFAADANTYYFPLNGVGSPAPTGGARYVLAQHAGVLKNFRIYLTAAPAGATSRAFNVYVEGAATALTISFGAADSGLKSDVTHSVVVAVGNRMCVQMVPGGGSPAAAAAYGCVEYFTSM